MEKKNKEKKEQAREELTRPSIYILSFYFPQITHGQSAFQNHNWKEIHVTGAKRENASEQVAIGLSSTSDWLRKWREIF